MVADRDGYVYTNASNMNIPEEATNGPPMNIAGLEQTLVITTGGAVAAKTAIVAADEEGEGVHVVGTMPAITLL